MKKNNWDGRPFGLDYADEIDMNTPSPKQPDELDDLLWQLAQDCAEDGAIPKDSFDEAKARLQALLTESRIDELERTWINRNHKDIQTHSDKTNFMGKQLIITKQDRIAELKGGSNE
jgi:hypothetical protein